MARRPTKLDRAIDSGWGLQAFERPLKDNTDSPESTGEPGSASTTTDTSATPVVPSNGRSKARKKTVEFSGAEIEQIAELKGLYLDQLIKNMKAGTVRASMLAVVGKLLDQTGAFDHKPGKTKPKTTELDAEKYKGLPFPVDKQINDPAKVNAEWKTPDN